MNGKVIRSLDEGLDDLKTGEILEITMPKENAKFLRGHIMNRGYEITGEYDDNNSKIYHVILNPSKRRKNA